MEPHELIGKTIKTAVIVGISEEFDDKPFLDLEFTDGVKIRIEAETDFHGYTGNSENEYPRVISIYTRGD
jgi:hypothetical protein